MIPSYQALLSLPSPPSPVIFEAGPFVLRYYGLFVVLGIVIGTWVTGRGLARRGYDGDLALESLFFVLPLGLAGARLYHVATEYDQYGDRLAKVFFFWFGGWGIYGAVAGGFLGLFLFSRYRGIKTLVFADAAAPGLALGQAIGRWGNYFNQELFGRPSDLPWAIRIAPENRIAPMGPMRFADATSFHPTFFYESVWDLLIALTLLWVARRFADRLKNGDVFVLYVSLYSVGRFFVETLRIDPAFIIGSSFRGNLLVSDVLAVGFALILILRHAHRPGARPDPD